MHIQKLMRSDMSADGAVRSATTLDNCQLMETVHENHANHLIPQVEQYKAMYESLYQRCLEDKVSTHEAHACPLPMCRIHNGLNIYQRITIL